MASEQPLKVRDEAAMMGRKEGGNFVEVRGLRGHDLILSHADGDRAGPSWSIDSKWFEFSGDPSSLALASGPITGHADFFNAWDVVEMADEIRQCIHRGVICGLTSSSD